MKEKFAEFIAKARAGGAWEELLDGVENLSGWEEFWNHRKAPLIAYWYAKNVLRSRWLEAEPIIAKKPDCSYAYALNVVRKRWPEGEPAIIQHPMWAYYYNIYVLLGCLLYTSPSPRDS